MQVCMEINAHTLALRAWLKQFTNVRPSFHFETDAENWNELVGSIFVGLQHSPCHSLKVGEVINFPRQARWSSFFSHPLPERYTAASGRINGGEPAPATWPACHSTRLAAVVCQVDGALWSPLFLL